ncbi:hypothetical protein BDC45DRAFT_68025 [Circinella umbellata]|nr:hypothetical protein BDC45DRAFT_68025 [Circinella umbellata]
MTTTTNVYLLCVLYIQPKPLSKKKLFYSSHSLIISMVHVFHTIILTLRLFSPTLPLLSFPPLNFIHSFSSNYLLYLFLR